MNTIPSAAELHARISTLREPQLQRLSELSGVPLPTIHKIRFRQTKNPRLDTVRALIEHIDAARVPAAA